MRTATVPCSDTLLSLAPSSWRAADRRIHASVLSSGANWGALPFRRSLVAMNSDRLTTLLADRRIFDGGYGWLLQERGLPAGDVAELWNVENPVGRRGAARGVRRGRRSGADHQHLWRDAPTPGRSWARGTRCRDQRGRRARSHVGSPIGTTPWWPGVSVRAANFLSRYGALSESEAHANCSPSRSPRWPRGGADLILIETMSDLGEASAAVVAAAAKVAPDLPIIVTHEFRHQPAHDDGCCARRCVRGSSPALGVDAVGANCGRGPDDMSQIATALASARSHADLDGVLLIAQSNAGLPHVHGDGFVYDVDPAGMAAHALELREIGMDVIGACCGSSPEHIAAMAEALQPN